VTEAVQRRWLDRLRAVVAARLGMLVEDDNRVQLLAEVAAERARATGARSTDAYVAALEADAAPEEVRALAERITVGETYFFRNANDLRAFVGAVLPERIRARLARGERRLRVLSAGCSSGEEPYTLAMLAHEVPELASWDLAIRALDVNPAAIARARTARYSTWSLRQTGHDLRERFFTGGPREFQVVDEVRALVAFEEHNLVDEDPRTLPAATYDVVFCRNVLMYFGPEATRRVVARLAASLLPGGFLFLGHAETLRGVSTAFHLCHTHDTFYYQVREERLAEAPPPPVAGAGPALPAVDASAEAAADVDWVAAIREASERIARLTGEPAPAREAEARAPPPGAAPAAGTPPRAAGTAAVLDLVRQERFGEALAALGPPPAQGEEDRDALLLRAVVLASSGDPALAEDVCDRLLAIDELSAEAHYVKALCREHAGDRAAAANHDHYALYLDPTFAMPRLHLGLMAKRAGDVQGARRELSRALALLAGEAGSRILLLGAGFGRDALLAFCRAELRACGGLA
jgi:chemotaxis protein methyltransferase CheR